MTFIQTAVKPRINHAIDLPLEALGISLYALPAIAYGFKALAYAFLSVGLGSQYLKPSLRVAEKKLNNSQYFFSRIYYNAIGFLYPITMKEIGGQFKSKIIGSGGYLTSKIELITKKAADFSHSDNSLHRIGSARFTYAMALVALSVARIADFVLGIFVGAISLFPIVMLPFEKSEKWHSDLGIFVYDQLQVTGFVKDVFTLGALIINPQMARTPEEVRKHCEEKRIQREQEIQETQDRQLKKHIQETCTPQ